MAVVQLYPNRLAITPGRDPFTCQQMLDNKVNDYFFEASEASLANLKIKNHPFYLSRASTSKLKDSINTMLHCSKARTVWRRDGKPIYNFRQAFITLTLPSAQKHSDITIKKKCLDHFFTELRQRYAVKNYVWKAELQEKGNIHFHIFIDKFIDYKVLRWVWNRITEKLGYVSVYSDKMKKLSLGQYAELRGKKPVEVFEAYNQGKKDKWSNPNSVDVRSIFSERDMAVYVAKYVSKNLSGEAVEMPDGTIKRKINIAMLIREKSFGRSWARSYSLAQVKYIFKWNLHDVREIIQDILACKNAVKEFMGDFFRVIYFQVSKMPQWFKRWHARTIVENAYSWSYPFPVVYKFSNN